MIEIETLSSFFTGTTSEDPGARWHAHKATQHNLEISAAFCEWIISLLVVVYMLSLVPEFRMIHLTGFVQTSMAGSSSEKHQETHKRTATIRTVSP